MTSLFPNFRNSFHHHHPCHSFVSETLRFANAICHSLSFHRPWYPLQVTHRNRPGTASVAFDGDLWGLCSDDDASSDIQGRRATKTDALIQLPRRALIVLTANFRPDDLAFSRLDCRNKAVSIRFSRSGSCRRIAVYCSMFSLCGGLRALQASSRIKTYR